MTPVLVRGQHADTIKAAFRRTTTSSSFELFQMLVGASEGYCGLELAEIYTFYRSLYHNWPMSHDLQAMALMYNQTMHWRYLHQLPAVNNVACRITPLGYQSLINQSINQRLIDLSSLVHVSQCQIMMSGNDGLDKNVFSRWRTVAIDHHHLFAKQTVTMGCYHTP